MFVPCLDLDELTSSGIVDLNTGMLIFGIGYHHCCLRVFKSSESTGRGL